MVNLNLLVFEYFSSISVEFRFGDRPTLTLSCWFQVGSESMSQQTEHVAFWAPAAPHRFRVHHLAPSPHGKSLPCVFDHGLEVTQMYVTVAAF